MRRKVTEKRAAERKTAKLAFKIFLKLFTEAEKLNVKKQGDYFQV